MSIPVAATRGARPALWRRLHKRAGAIGGPRGLPLLAALGSAVFLWLAISPLAGPANDTDAAASVLYFQRIVAGRHLEAFVPTAAKPLLTVEYGVLWTLTHDWRSLTIATLIVASAGSGLAAVLARRLAGSAAAAVAVVGLLAWPEFWAEVAHANSFVHALALWLLAGVLIEAERPRHWLAGLALLLAGLARPETVWLVAAAFAGIVALAARRRNGRSAGPAFRLPLLLGGLAVPLVCLHDWLLTGQPLYWLHVPDAYTAMVYPNMEPISLQTFLDQMLTRAENALPVLLLAVVGVAALARARRWAVALGVCFLTSGVTATLLVLGLRGTYIDARYFEELDAPILFAAAIGAGMLLREAGTQVRGNPSAWVIARNLAAGAAAAALAVLLAWPLAGDATNADDLGRRRAASAGLASVSGDLPGDLTSAEPRRGSGSTTRWPTLEPVLIFVPRALLPRIAVETSASLTALGDPLLAFRGGTYGALRAGQWVLHIAAADGPGGIYAPFEVTRPAPASGSAGSQLVVVPVVADPARGVWLDRIVAAPAP